MTDLRMEQKRRSERKGETDMSDKKLDVLVIGSGPAGLSAAIYAKRANLNVLVAEKQFMGTGQVAESGHVDNYLGFSGINGFDLGMAFRDHATKLNIDFYDGEAEKFEAQGDGWRVSFTNGESLSAKAVIYCAGAYHRHLGAAGEEKFQGRGVSYCAICDGAFFRGKTTAVIGGGNTALDDALYLSELCEKVYVVHRRNEFRGSAVMVEQLKNKENVELVTEARVAEITGDAKVDGVQLEDGRKLDTDGVFIAVGMIPQTASLKGVVELDESGYIVADETGETSAKGFFVAGDVRTKRLRQVITAASDGANAATSAAEYIKAEGDFYVS